MSWEKSLRKLEEMRGQLWQFRVSFLTDRNFVELVNHLRNPVDTDVMGYRVIGYRNLHTTHIDISGYFSGGIVNILCAKAREQCKIRLLSPPLDLRHAQDRRNLSALRRMQDDGIEIRINDRNHSRLLVIYRTEEGTIINGALVIGSFDFNREGLSGERRDAGIITLHPDLVESAVAFFNEIWETRYETETLDTKYPPTS